MTNLVQETGCHIYKGSKKRKEKANKFIDSLGAPCVCVNVCYNKWRSFLVSFFFFFLCCCFSFISTVVYEKKFFDFVNILLLMIWQAMAFRYGLFSFFFSRYDKKRKEYICSFFFVCKANIIIIIIDYSNLFEIYLNIIRRYLFINEHVLIRIWMII